MAASSIAAVILEQLGGARFTAMTGARQFIAGERALIFSLPKAFAKDGINKIRIELELSDLYTVTAYRIARRGLNVTTIAERSGVYAENLREVFRTITGLEVSL